MYIQAISYSPTFDFQMLWLIAKTSTQICNHDLLIYYKSNCYMIHIVGAKLLQLLVSYIFTPLY